MPSRDAFCLILKKCSCSSPSLPVTSSAVDFLPKSQVGQTSNISMLITFSVMMFFLHLATPFVSWCNLVIRTSLMLPIENLSNFRFVMNFFMPLWSLEEMRKLNQALPVTSPFHIPIDPILPTAAAGGVDVGAPFAGTAVIRAPAPAYSELESRFFRWGGCVRSVFDTCDTWRKEALQALSNLADLNALNDAVGKVRVNPKAFGRLIHLEVDLASFQPIKSIIASDLIAEEIARQTCCKKFDDVIAFLRDSHGYSSLAPLSGHLFEAVVHLSLKKRW